MNDEQRHEVAQLDVKLQATAGWPNTIGHDASASSGGAVARLGAGVRRCVKEDTEATENA